jgi:hypothetical protein
MSDCCYGNEAVAKDETFYHPYFEVLKQSLLANLFLFFLTLCLHQGESVFRLYNVSIVDFYYLFNCATCFGHTTIFMQS